MCRLIATVIGAAGLAFSAPANAAERPRIGLALSGGGALGAAHVGVIRVLEELAVPIDFVAGTSMGAIVGAYYAAGMNADEVEAVLANADWNDLFSDKPPREDRDMRRKFDDMGFLIRYKLGFRDGRLQPPLGLVQGQKLDLLFRSYAVDLVATQDFDQLPIPYRAVATDIETGEPVVIDSGDLVSAIKASFAVPGVFPPVEIDGRWLVDGGLANNLPIDVVRDMGADIVIAVTLPAPLSTKDELHSAIDILGQSLSILVAQNERRQLATLGPRDVLITPELGDMGSADFHLVMSTIEPGEAAARAVETRLRQLAALGTGRLPVASVTTSEPEPTRVDFVRIVSNGSISEEVIRSRIRLRPGDALDIAALEEDIADVYGLDFFETVIYQVVTEAEQKGVVITADERSSGLQSFRFGLKLENDFDGDSRYELGVRYQSEGLTPYGGEAIVEGRIGEEFGGFVAFVQPLDARTRYLVTPSVSYLERDVPVFDGGRQIAEVRTHTLVGSLSLARQFGEWGVALIGIRRGIADFDVNVGDPGLIDDDFAIGNAFAEFRYDKLDDTSFPKHGEIGQIRFTQSLVALGADDDYSQLQVNGAVARSWGRNTGVIALDTRLTIDNDAPVQDLFDLGGFLRLSGLQRRALTGQNAALGQLIFYREVSGIDGSLLNVPIYVGGSFEAGNVYDSLSDIDVGNVQVAGSVFIGADTFLGPVFLATGLAEGGNFSPYLVFGKTFGQQ